MNRWITGILVCGLLSCGQAARKAEEGTKTETNKAGSPARPEQAVFPMPEIPGMIASEEEARNYLVAHFLGCL